MGLIPLILVLSRIQKEAELFWKMRRLLNLLRQAASSHFQRLLLSLRPHQPPLLTQPAVPQANTMLAGQLQLALLHINWSVPPITEAHGRLSTPVQVFLMAKISATVLTVITSEPQIRQVPALGLPVLRTA